MSEQADNLVGSKDAVGDTDALPYRPAAKPIGWMRLILYLGLLWIIPILIGAAWIRSETRRESIEYFRLIKGGVRTTNFGYENGRFVFSATFDTKPPWDDPGKLHTSVFWLSDKIRLRFQWPAFGILRSSEPGTSNMYGGFQRIHGYAFFEWIDNYYAPIWIFFVGSVALVAWLTHRLVQRFKFARVAGRR